LQDLNPRSYDHEFTVLPLCYLGTLPQPHPTYVLNSHKNTLAKLTKQQVDEMSSRPNDVAADESEWA
jgi:hypothetical protein